MKTLIRETVDSEMVREGVKYVATLRVQQKMNKKNGSLKPPPMIGVAKSIESALECATARRGRLPYRSHAVFPKTRRRRWRSVDWFLSRARRNGRERRRTTM